MSLRHAPQCARRSERGAFSIVYALTLVPILTLAGMAVDLSMAYWRRVDLQVVADGAALAAARSMDGTLAGIAGANGRARQVVEVNRYARDIDIEWPDGVLRFSATPDLGGNWLPASAINDGNVASMRSASLDTRDLAPEYGTVTTIFMRAFGQGTSITLGSRAVAGRSAVSVTPLVICAIDNVKISSRTAAPGFVEQIEHGFRRGISYNLLNLNPQEASPKSYLINPVDFPPGADHPGHRTSDSVRPLICSGTLAAPFLTNGSQVYVSEPFPPELTAALNSRVGVYAGATPCNPTSAPSDVNVKQFNDAPGFWINLPDAWLPIRASAEPALVGGKLLTVAEASGASPGTLYPVASPEQLQPKINYPTAPNGPYAAGSPFLQLPPLASRPGVEGRRILNIPLLSCPVVAGNTATVLAVGRFLMTAHATETPPAVHAEFAGLATESSPVAAVALFR